MGDSGKDVGCICSSYHLPLTFDHHSMQGCDTFTISPSVAMKMFMVESTLDYFVDFEAAARRNGAYGDLS